MPKGHIYQKPEELTVEKLKKELTKHGVSPPKRALKAKYVQLYKDNVLREKSTRSGFSSDEEIFETPAKQTRSSQKAKNSELRVNLTKLEYSDEMTVDSFEIQQLSDDQLRIELKRRGFTAGPIGPTTRRLYERKLENVLKNGGAGDVPKEEYSDEESDQSDEVDVEEEEPPPVSMDTRHKRRSLLQSTITSSMTKSYSSAPNLTRLDYPQNASKPTKKNRSPPIAIPKSRTKHPNVGDSPPDDPPSFDINDDMGLSRSYSSKGSGKMGTRGLVGSQSLNMVCGGYDAFQKGVHADPFHQGGVSRTGSHDSFIDVVNRTNSTLINENSQNEMSRLRLDVSGASDFSSIHPNMDDTLNNSGQVLNSTKINQKPPSKAPLTSHLAAELLSPSVPAGAYSRRLKQICGSATRRRPMRHEPEDVRVVPKQDSPRKPVVPHADDPLPSSKIQKQEPLKSERRWIPVWIQILVVLGLVVFLYLVVQSMEPNPKKPILPGKL